MAKRGRKKVVRKKVKKTTRGRGKRARRLDQMGIEQLEAVLDRKKRQLGKLARDRDRLLARVAKVERKMAQLGGTAPARGRPAAVKGRVGRPPGDGRKRRKFRGGLTLGNKMLEILSAAKKPMRVVEILGAVQQSNYPSKSPHLRSMVNQTLSNDPRFRKVGRGVYRVA